MTNHPLPNAVCIGASKCGTTSLHYYLHAHPQLGLPRSKEVHFFLDPGNWHRGEQWYRQQFPQGRVLVESFGGGYTHYPLQQGVAQRMHEILPHGKFIYMVRDPVERMISRYVHNVCAFIEEREPAEAFSGDPLENLYTSESLYFTQLRQFLEYFDEDQFLIVDFNSFKNHRPETLRNIFKFLGVDEEFSSRDFEIVRHPSARKRRKNVTGVALNRYFGRYLLKTLEKLPLPMATQRALTHHTDQLMYWMFSKPMQRPQLEPALRSRLNDLFRPEVRQLEQFAGRQFPDWLT
jgi:hypothetical protein